MQSTEPTTTTPLANHKPPNTDTTTTHPLVNLKLPHTDTTTPPLANLKLPNTELTTTGVDTNLSCHVITITQSIPFWWTISPLLPSRKCFSPDMVYEIYILLQITVPN